MNHCQNRYLQLKMAEFCHRECCILRNRIDVFCLFLDDGGVRASLRAPQLFHRVPSASHQHNFQPFGHFRGEQAKAAAHYYDAYMLILRFTVVLTCL
uniref:Uncharacterized protein isoform X4 n=1 Tax=Nicotiana tabacum TaxID=4097 RepID=A0A1S4B2Q0_TOBAC|nr:uncharacterized protein LOC104097191 isoform X2 [Nicotiana tomentosiformis]XP_016483207.1 PREDICTED: uncharacterized protein LOC107803927 isoform X4 [Nicotiana tabacum]